MDELKAAEQLINDIEEYSSCHSDLLSVCQKLARKVKADIGFLKKTVSKNRLTKKEKNVSCNLAYLTGVFVELKRSQNVKEVIYDHRRFSIVIDIICDDGKVWKKIVARNPQNLHMIWAAQGQYGNKDIVIKLEQYLDAAKRQCEFSPPDVAVVFSNGVTHELAQHIESMGITVGGERVGVAQEVIDKLQGLDMLEDSTDEEDYDTDYEDEELEESSGSEEPSNSQQLSGSESIELENLYEKLRALKTEDKVFLDTTTMMVYVCDICNGGSNHHYGDKVLDYECRHERTESARDIIRPALENRTLITSQSALHDYKYMVEVQAGSEEKRRAEALIERLTVVPDRLSQRYISLSSSAKIKDRSKVIFGSADYLRCPILTSNEGFIRGAEAQGIHVPAIIHQSRAFSERKRLEQQQSI